MTKLKMACAGERLTTSERLAQAWAPENDPADIRIYKGGLVKYAGIGAVYEFTLTDTDSIIVSGENAPVRVTGTWVDDDLRMIWEAADRDARTTYESIQIRKREKDMSLIREALLPIRVAMERKPRQAGRSAMVNAVSEELWRPLTKAEKKEAGL